MAPSANLHRRIGRLTVLEGVDGKGKTSLASALADKTNAILYKAPTAEYRRIHPVPALMPMTPYNVTRRFVYFIEAMEWAANEVQTILETGQDVVADRWIWTTQAYHMVRYPPLADVWPAKLQYISDMVGTALLVDIPDRRLWIKRLMARSTDSAADRFTFGHLDQLNEIDSMLRSVNPSFVVIDNSGPFAESVVQMLQTASR